MIRFAAAIVFLTVTSATVRADNLIVNGSFESGKYDAPGYVRVFPGDNRINGWVVGGMGVDWHVATANPAQNPNFTGPHFGPAADGSLVMDLNLDGGGTGTGTIQQTFLTVPGHTYHVSFRMAASNFFLNPRAVVVQLLNGQAVSNYTFQTFTSPQYGMVWSTFEFSFVAGLESSETTLRFASPNGSGFWGPLLDDIQVYPDDSSKPRVTRCIANIGSGGATSFDLDFSETIDPRRGSLLPANYRVLSSGADGLFGTGDDRDYPVDQVFSAQFGMMVRIQFATAVPIATPLRIIVRGSGIFDIYGNSMAEDFVKLFPQGPRAPR